MNITRRDVCALCGRGGLAITPTPIQRYDIENITTMGEHDRTMARNSYGDYVLYDDHLAAMAAASVAVPRWIPVSERMPDEGHVVLVHLRCGCCDTSSVSMGRYESEDGWSNLYGFDEETGMGQWKPTHWMPLPQPPKETTP